MKEVKGKSNEKSVKVENVVEKGGRYKFEEILKGKYKINVEKDEWCWE
jgi:hypothetical protein